MWWSPCRKPGSTCTAWPISTTSPPRSASSTSARCASRPNTSISRAISFPRTASPTTASWKARAPPKARPAAGTAELIVDITTTGATLAANALKVIEDGVILRSQANLVAARTAALGRGRARDRAHRARPHRRAGARARFPRGAHALCRLRRRRCSARRSERFGVATPFGGPTSSGMLTLHCPPEHVHALATLPARAGRRDRGGRGSRLRLLQRQSALRQARGRPRAAALIGPP